MEQPKRVESISYDQKLIEMCEQLVVWANANGLEKGTIINVEGGRVIIVPGL